MIPVKDGFIELDIPIYYRMYGDGDETVVFLHGNGENWKCFKKQIEPFAEKYRVLLIDSRGHGQSGYDYKKKLSIDLMADDVYGVLQHLGLEQVYLVGFSDGGNIAMALVRKHPEVLKKLVLAGANMFPRGMKLTYHLMTIFSWLAVWLYGIFAAGRRKARRIMGLMVLEPKFKPADFAAADLPVLVMAGENDMIKTRHTFLIKQSFVNSRISIIKDSDHFIFYRQPEVVNSEIMKFFAED